MTRYRSALVTGGAGFIGTHAVAALAAISDHVTVFDNLHPQVHGVDAPVPDNMAARSFVRGDIRDRAAVFDCVRHAAPDLIVHLAAETGTGQSFDQVGHYCDANIQGTAWLAEAIRDCTGDRKCRVVLTSSRAIYGEGAWHDQDGRLMIPSPRRPEDMRAGRFVPLDGAGHPLVPVATAEDAPLSPASIYASTKLMQEYILAQSLAGSAAELVILRLQNVFGPGQSLHNPYTGVLSIFAQQIIDGKLPLNIYEDGQIVRDFVFVDDVVRALIAAATVTAAPVVPINIGTGAGISILDAARLLLTLFGQSPDACRISGDFRIGDVRYARADISRAQALLGWSPEITVEEGMARLVRSIAGNPQPL